MPSPSPRILITAGPTEEPIDDVRFISNRSSGRMGLALADAARRAGHRASLLLGPVHMKPPVATDDDSQFVVKRFRTTEDLAALLTREWPNHDVLIMAAAVADYRPIARPDQQKIPRGESRLTLELEPTPDLVASLASSSRDDQFIIGFALEPADQIEEAARAKLQRKGLDAIVANPLETMDAKTVTAHLFLKRGDRLDPPGNASKEEFAKWLMERLPDMMA